MDDSGCATKWRRAAVRRALGTSRTEDQAVRAGGGELDRGGGEVARFCQCNRRLLRTATATHTAGFDSMSPMDAVAFGGFHDVSQKYERHNRGEQAIQCLGLSIARLATDYPDAQAEKEDFGSLRFYGWLRRTADLILPAPPQLRPALNARRFYSR